jgi:hypothetical protein
VRARRQTTLTHATANATTSIGRHVSGIADPFTGHIDEFRIAHVQRSDGWIESYRFRRSSCAGHSRWISV